MATVSNPPLVRMGMTSVLGSIMVSGPGQKGNASFLAEAGISLNKRLHLRKIGDVNHQRIIRRSALTPIFSSQPQDQRIGNKTVNRLCGIAVLAFFQYLSGCPYIFFPIWVKYSVFISPFTAFSRFPWIP